MQNVSEHFNFINSDLSANQRHNTYIFVVPTLHYLPILAILNKVITYLKHRLKMKPEMKYNKTTRNVVSFYIKLYCKRKGSTKTKCSNSLVEASKSWLSLSDEEKHNFYTKFKECEIKFNNKFINCLEKAEPFMKQKECETERVPDMITANNSSGNNNESGDNDPSQSIMNELSDGVDQDIISENFGFLNNVQNDKPIMLEQETVNLQQDTGNALCEPAPPILKSGRELFEMLQSIGEKTDTTWTSLSSIERVRYNCAILSLKYDYIRKYMAYLDSLSSRDLFNHYNKLIS